jgi:MerR family mercuric resistance operon transcriptional regulator
VKEIAARTATFAPLYASTMQRQDAGAFPVREDFLIVSSKAKARTMPAIAPATIAELARKAGVDVALVRSYEEMGLLPRPRRRRGRSGDSAYHQEHLDRLLFIRRALEFGFPIETIAELAGVKGGLQTCNDIYQLADRHLSDLRQRIADLQRIESTLAGLVAACPRTGGSTSCSVLAALKQPG